MTVAAVMIVRDEERALPQLLESVQGLTDSIVALDTGSTDRTLEVLARYGAHVIEAAWTDYSTARNRVMDEASDRADWLLMLDADTYVEWVDDLPAFLAEDTSPETEAWEVERAWGDTRWRVPLLTRAGAPWRYVEPVHEYLVCPGHVRRWLLGMTVHTIKAGGSEPEKFERWLELLRPGYERREPRATYYYADALRCMGRTDEAIVVYRERYGIEGGFEEERWHAGYRAGLLAQDAEELVRVWEARPHRHEPLSAAARIVARAGANDDVLFLEAHST